MAISRPLSHLLSSARFATSHIDEQAPFDGQQRSPFEIDGDKIGFTDGFRALADKTQVHDRVEHMGNHRNRLTHSIEVSRVGRSLGVALGARMISYYGLHTPASGEAFWRVDPTDIGHIVSAACLAHDLGNPPFGHDGERAISDFFTTTDRGRNAVAQAGDTVGAELCQHEGNAQGFRMITRSLGWREFGGLNLTAATLGAFGKYPFPLQPGQAKYGIHAADMDTARFVARATGMIPCAEGWQRHPLAWLMEAADDICYLTVDLEDVAFMGLVDIDTLCDLYTPIVGQDEIDRGRRMNNPARMIQYLRSRMIKNLINGCVEIYADIADILDTGTLGKTAHGSGLLAHTPHAEAMQAIRTFSRTEIYQSATTQHFRHGFRAAMGAMLDKMVDELSWVLSRGAICQDTIGQCDTLRRLPHSIIQADIPMVASEAYPWLMDQITLMSDAQVLSASRATEAADVPADMPAGTSVPA